MSIRNRILAAFLTLITLTLFFSVFHAQRELRPRYLEAVEDTLVDASNYFAQTIESSFVDPKSGELQVTQLQESWQQLLRKSPEARIYAKGKSSIELRIYITNKDGIVVLDTAEKSALGQDYKKWNDVLRTLRGQYGARSTREDPTDDMTSVLYVAAPIKFREQVIGVISLGKPLSSFNTFMITARNNLVMGIGISLALTLLLSLLLSQLISKPIDKEIEARKYIGEYVHHLTHEFKSPVTGIIGAAELLDSGKVANESDRNRLLKNILSEGHRLKEVSESLLELAALEKRATALKLERIRINDFLEELAENFSPQLLLKKLEIQLQLSPLEPIVMADRFLLWRALANLIQNAIDFSPEGTKVTLRSETDKTNIRIIVEDEGFGISDQISGRVFEKFFSTARPDTGKKGSGLGLPFVKEVAEQHQGSVSIYSPQDGRGTQAVINLPQPS